MKKKIICISVVAMLISSCTNKGNLHNQITIKINSIDSKTKQRRVNMFDPIDVRMTKFGILTQEYIKVAEYIMDSTGSVEIKVDSNEEYRFMISGANIYGSSNFTKAFSKEKLKDGQEVNIEVISLDNR
jgi:hypothetical protein